MNELHMFMLISEDAWDKLQSFTSQCVGARNKNWMWGNPPMSMFLRSTDWTPIVLAGYDERMWVCHIRVDRVLYSKRWIDTRPPCDWSVFDAAVMRERLPV